MRKLRMITAVILCLCFVLPLMPSFSPDTEAAYSATGANDKKYKTYTMSDCDFLWCPADVSNPSGACTASQGLNIGTSYAYIAMHYNDKYQSIQRYNLNTGETAIMQCYDSLSDTSAANYSTKLAHANELQVISVDGVNYMYVATCTTDKTLATSIARMKVDGKKLYFTGYIDLVTTSGSSIKLSGITYVKVSGDYIYMLCKTGGTVYLAKIPKTMSGGSTPEKAEKVTAYKMFVMDRRNAVFAKSSTSAGVYDGLEKWTNQGGFYNRAEGVFYYPVWDGDGSTNRNAILTYNLKDILTDERMNANKNYSDVVYPTVTSFLFQNTGCDRFEIESCGFRTGQGTTGDLRMYANFDASSSVRSKYEGLWVCSYKSGSGDFTPINEGTTTWKTVYNANGGTGSVSSTRHVYGISTKLAANAFTRSGYTFAGWYLTRKSDNKWLYKCSDGATRWYLKGEQPVGAVLALYSDKQSVSKLSATEGDTVTCYAQWTPNSTGTTTFYIQYDANGGTGTMADTKIVRGNAVNISKNTFTRDGYVFAGWYAYRRSDAKIAYKRVVNGEFSNVWYTLDQTPADTDFLKTYSDGCALSTTSSVDRDIITLYASWVKVEDPLAPTELKKGTAFTLGGTVDCDTGIYMMTAEVKNSAGAVVASYSTSPLANTCSLSGANGSIDFSKLDVGDYTYSITIQTVNGSTPTVTEIYSKAFSVLGQLLPAAKVRFEDIVSSAQFDSEYGVTFTYTKADGTPLAQGEALGTGTKAVFESNVSVIILTTDLDGDGAHTANDLLKLKAHFKNVEVLEGVFLEAADANASETLTVTDYLILKRRMMTSK